MLEGVFRTTHRPGLARPVRPADTLEPEAGPRHGGPQPALGPPPRSVGRPRHLPRGPHALTQAGRDTLGTPGPGVRGPLEGAAAPGVLVLGRHVVGVGGTRRLCSDTGEPAPEITVPTRPGAVPAVVSCTRDEAVQPLCLETAIRMRKRSRTWAAVRKLPALAPAPDRRVSAVRVCFC